MHGICHGYRWRMPCISLVYATDIAGKCRAFRWYMPRISLANAVHQPDRCDEACMPFPVSGKSCEKCHGHR